MAGCVQKISLDIVLVMSLAICLLFIIACIASYVQFKRVSDDDITIDNIKLTKTIFGASTAVGVLIGAIILTVYAFAKPCSKAG